MPKAYDQLCAVRAILESYYKEMQDLEFTVEDEKLYMLQCRTGKRSPMAAFQHCFGPCDPTLVDHVRRPMIWSKKGILPKKYAQGRSQAGHYQTRSGQPYFFR